MNMYEEFVEISKKLRELETKLNEFVKNTSSAMAEAFSRIEKLEKKNEKEKKE